VGLKFRWCMSTRGLLDLPQALGRNPAAHLLNKFQISGGVEPNKSSITLENLNRSWGHGVSESRGVLQSPRCIAISSLRCVYTPPLIWMDPTSMGLTVLKFLPYGYDKKTSTFTQGSFKHRAVTLKTTCLTQRSPVRFAEPVQPKPPRCTEGGARENQS
jgi:hypothetical protein